MLCSGLRSPAAAQRPHKQPSYPSLRRTSCSRQHPTSTRRLVNMMAAAPQQQTQQQGGPLSSASLPFPPQDVFLLAGCEKGSFAEDTITRRLPGILEGVVSDLAQEAAAAPTPEAAAQASAAQAAVQQLIADIKGNALLTPIATPPGAPQHLKHIIGTTNDILSVWQQRTTTTTTTSSSRASWLELPWLVIECYMYVRLAAALAAQPALAAAGYDPFRRQKEAALTASARSLVEVGAAVLALVNACDQQQQQQQEEEDKAGAAGGEAAYTQFVEALQYALWGNKTDLSLFTVASLETHAMNPAAQQQAGAAGSNNANTSSTSSSSSQGQVNTGPLLVDDSAALWAHMQAHGGGNIHLVLDNSGLELFTDLCLAEYLLSSGLAGKVTLHGKVAPYFVSDTLEGDLEHLLGVCASSSPPEGLPADTAGNWPAVQALAGRWRQRLEAGDMVYTAPPFWTTPAPTWWMQQLDPGLAQELAAAPLVIFKGDLNYRKLVFDGRWEPTTPFPTALGPFASTATLLSLRTLKADTIAGLAPGQAEAVGAVDAGWQVNGKFGVVQFSKAG